MKILLDTNFLLIPAQFKVDIFSEIDRIVDEPYKLYILEKTIDELNKIIKEQKSRHKEAANIALKLIKQKGLNTIKNSTNYSVDDIIVDIADDYVVATQDKELKKRLKEKNIKIITLRAKKYLVIR
jgi:uncharacterized protein